MRLFPLLFLISVLSVAQPTDKEDYIYLKRNAHIDINLNNGEFDIVKRISEQAQYLTGKKLYLANESIGYNGFMEIGAINAFTYLPESDTKIPVDHIETKQQFDNMGPLPTLNTTLK